MKRTDFRPNNSSSSISKKDREYIKKHKAEQGELERFGTPKSMGKEGTTKAIKSFINNESYGHKGSTISSDGKHLYSYNTVIATRQNDGSVVLNNTNYSAKTLQQQRETESLLKANHVRYDVTGDKPLNYEGEDYSKKENIRTIREQQELDRQIELDKEYHVYKTKYNGKYSYKKWYEEREKAIQEHYKEKNDYND